MRILQIYSGNLFGGIEKTALNITRIIRNNYANTPEISLDKCLCAVRRGTDIGEINDGRSFSNQRPLEMHSALCFDGELSRMLKAEGASVQMLGEVRLRAPVSVWKARRALKGLLAAKTYDVALIHSVWSQVVFGPTIRSRGLPLVFWLHDCVDGKHWLERLASRTRPDLAICNSKFTAAQLPKLYPGTKTELIYNPVPSHGVSERDHIRRTVRAEINVPEEAVVIIQVSRMEPWKGQALHLEALSRLPKDLNWSCLFVGGAQRRHEEIYLRELMGMASRLGLSDRVKFLGQRSDIERLLAASDIHCQPNIGPEPFGNTFVEGLSAGLPVVTTEIGGAKEIVDESCGILTKPGDAIALAESLCRLIESRELRHRLAANGPARARRLCEPAAQVQRLVSILAQVAGC